MTATERLGYPTTGATMIRWADEAGIAPADEPAPLSDDRLRLTLARLVDKIDHRLTAELYVATPTGVQAQPLAGAELNQIAAGLERIVATHRLLDGDPGTITEQRHTLGAGTARLLDRSLAATRRRRTLVLDTHSKALP